MFEPVNNFELDGKRRDRCDGIASRIRSKWVAAGKIQLNLQAGSGTGPRLSKAVWRAQGVDDLNGLHIQSKQVSIAGCACRQNHTNHKRLPRRHEIGAELVHCAEWAVEEGRGRKEPDDGPNTAVLLEIGKDGKVNQGKPPQKTDEQLPVSTWA